jgi:hypothetical protein
MLLYHIAKKRKIKTFVFYCPRVGNLYALSESYDDFPALFQQAQWLQAGRPEDKLYLEKAKNYLENFQRQPVYYLNTSAAFFNYVPGKTLYRKYFKFLLPRQFYQSIKWFFVVHFRYFLNKYKNDYTTIKPWHEVFDKIKQRARILRGYKGLYDKAVQEDYAYFSLHSEPEALPMLLAPFYTDQLWLIKQVARSLPVHYKLYVKDHPRMIGKRTRFYYRELKKIPSVKLMDPLTSSIDLIQKSKLVFAITGTASWEATLLKKPSVVFSKVFYSHLPMVKICENIQDLPKIIQEQINKCEYQEEEWINFIAAIYKESAELDLPQIWDVEGGAYILNSKRVELIPMVDLLAKKLGLHSLLR